MALIDDAVHYLEVLALEARPVAEQELAARLGHSEHQVHRRASLLVTSGLAVRSQEGLVLTRVGREGANIRCSRR